MPPAVLVRTAPQPRRCFVSFLAVVLLTIGAHAAAAQSWPDSGYARDLSAKSDDDKFSLHLHGGLFLPIDRNAPSPTVGLRLSKLVGSHLQAGVLTGYTLERKDQTQNESSLPAPQPEILLARTDASLVPLMGFLRVNFTEKSWLVPYFGIGVGYEWLAFKSTDFQTQVTKTATFSNWAWEGWGGMGIRLGQSLRVNGEVYYNGATLERDVVDTNGMTWTEVINLDGAGARFGLDIIF